jgi:hypothetical protein
LRALLHGVSLSQIQVDQSISKETDLNNGSNETHFPVQKLDTENKIFDTDTEGNQQSA